MKRVFFSAHPKRISHFSDELDKATKSLGLREEVGFTRLGSENSLVSAIEHVLPDALFIHTSEGYGFNVLNRIYRAGKSFPVYVVGTGSVPNKGKKMYYPATLIRMANPEVYGARLEKAFLEICHDCFDKEKFDEHRMRLIGILGDWENESLIRENRSHYTPLDGRRIRENGCGNCNTESCVDFRRAGRRIFRKRSHNGFGNGSNVTRH